MKGILERAFEIQCEQLVDSTLASTREYWRGAVLGHSPEIARDPRPLAVVLAEKARDGRDPQGNIGA